MNAVATAILVALLRTHNEGGAVHILYFDAAACDAAGEELEEKFESLTLSNGKNPTVKWVCIAGPDPRAGR